jgi:hypothetical protein
MEGRGGRRIDWRALASVAQWKSTSVLRSWLGVRVPPGAPVVRLSDEGRLGTSRSPISVPAGPVRHIDHELSVPRRHRPATDAARIDDVPWRTRLRCQPHSSSQFVGRLAVRRHDRRFLPASGGCADLLGPDGLGSRWNRGQAGRRRRGRLIERHVSEIEQPHGHRNPARTEESREE